MKVKHFPFLLLILTVFSLFSCKDVRIEEPPVTLTDYSKGVLVVNEGPFGGTGTVTWHHPETGETVQDVYGLANNGAVLGQFVQSLYVHTNGKTYICVNGASRVVVVDARTFEFIDTIAGVSSPRYFMPYGNDFAFVSQWHTDPSKAIAKVNLQTNEVVQYLPAGTGPEKMFLLNSNTLLVANSGGFGTDSTISAINLDTGLETDRLDAGEQIPCCLALPAFSNLKPYVLCKGYFADDQSQGSVGDFAPVTVRYTVDKYSDDLVSAPGGSALYFTGGGAIYRVDANGPERWLEQVTAYGLGCDPQNGDLYCADAKDFNSAGVVSVYSAGGQLKGTFPVGIAPGEVVIVR